MPKVLFRVSPTPLPPQERLAYPVQFLAKAIGVSPRFIHKLIRTGKLTAYKVGDRTIILPEDAQRLLRAEPIGRAEAPQTQESSTPSQPAIEMAAAPSTGVATGVTESVVSQGDSVVIGKVSNGNPK